MITTELREMSDDQLKTELAGVQRELFQLRVQASTVKLDAPSNLKKKRRTIARINTVLRQRELAAEKAAATAK